ncbi:tyrosine-protein phosphatase [Bryobacter aggregatus]|uniref:tyrosine-protein phosphatase n=1 Tax=Bryobacter aggregatus TaxID=360054 RepID=UPI00068AF3EC|nr:CpsB/CapC family capsule biosynthesis tyrosine phosphatase [Bryobacter aggregatus]
MIDIHSHVLYGMDDGSPDLDVTLEMLRMAGRHGTTDIVATPHANLEYKFDPTTIAERKALIEQRNDSGVRLHTGCDFHLQFENIEDALQYPRKYTIAGGKYMLVEFSDLIIFKTTAQIFSNLMAKGMVPVITHPERNTLLQQRLEELKTWVGMGCVIQLTGQSLEGVWGTKAQKFSETLLDAGLVHVIASDGHDLKRRPPILDTAYRWIEKRWNTEMAKLLFVENPGAILRSEDLLGASVARKKNFFSLFG